VAAISHRLSVSCTIIHAASGGMCDRDIRDCRTVSISHGSPWHMVVDTGDVLSRRIAQPRRTSCHGMCCDRIASDPSCCCCSCCLHASIRRRWRRRRAHRRCSLARITAIVHLLATVQIMCASATSDPLRRVTAQRATARKVRCAIWSVILAVVFVSRPVIAIVTASMAACAGLDGARATSGRSRRATAARAIARHRGSIAPAASAASETGRWRAPVSVQRCRM
jgi:hypothetical protein